MEDELPELGIDVRSAPDMPCGHSESNVPAFEFRHAGSTRVVIRDGELRKLTIFRDMNEETDAMEIDTTNLHDAPHDFQEARRYGHGGP